MSINHANGSHDRDLPYIVTPWGTDIIDQEGGMAKLMDEYGHHIKGLNTGIAFVVYGPLARCAASTPLAVDVDLRGCHRWGLPLHEGLAQGKLTIGAAAYDNCACDIIARCRATIVQF